MEKENYQASIRVNKPPLECTEAINRVKDWWVVKTEGKATSIHDNFKLDMGETHVSFRVTELDPGKKIVWLVTDCYIHWLKDKKEWKGTKVIWEIHPVKEETLVKMEHIGITPAVECFKACQQGWDFYVKRSLLKLITEGTGLPDKRKEYAS